MKTLWEKVLIISASIFLLVLIAYAETGRQYKAGVAYMTTITTKTLSSAASNYELLKDTNAGSNSYVIDSIIFSASTATYLYLNDSGANADIGWGYYRVPANGTIIDRDIILKLNAACGLYVTTGGAGEIMLEYHME